MAKTPSDKLFRLVKSLSPAEKRYFRIFLRGKTDRDSKYLVLFEAIAAQTEFDEAMLRQAVYKGEMPGSQKYSELKAYLYELILKSLQSFDEQQSVEYRLNHLLQGTAVLFRRGLYDDCRELLQKAEKIAWQYESFTHQTEIIRWKKQLAYTRMDVDYLHKNLELLHFEEARALEQLRNSAEYRRAFFRMYTLIKREAQHRGGDRTRHLKQVIDSDLFESPDQAGSHKARVLYYRTLNLYHYAALEYEQFYETGKKLIFLLESQPHFLRENLSDYIAALSNMILSCGLLQKMDEVRLCLEKLRVLKPQTVDDRRKIHRQYYSNKLALCLITGAFSEGRQEMERCQQEAAEFDAHDYETASFTLQYSCICFGCGDFSSALDYLNQALNQPRTVEREDLQSFARIFSLMIHFEMGNLVLLESLLRSATRFLQKKNRLYDIERRFIHFMAELLRCADRHEQGIVFRKMQADFQLLQNLPGAQALIQIFDLGAWLESKTSGRTLSEIMQEKWA